MKFIVSSKAFWILMEKERGFEPDEDGYRTLVIENKKCHFNAIAEIDIEAAEDGRIELSRKQFKSLRKVVRALSEQPIVLYVANRTLHIQNVVF